MSLIVFGETSSLVIGLLCLEDKISPVHRVFLAHRLVKIDLFPSQKVLFSSWHTFELCLSSAMALDKGCAYF